MTSMSISNIKPVTIVAALLALITPVLGYCQSDEMKERVADLRYGNALYHYFQGHELNALTQLQLAEVRGGIQGHGDNPELMKAGISLAYGMADIAQDIFVDLLDQNRPEKVRNAAWYYLARLHYMRESWEPALEASSRITKNIERSLIPSVQMIRTDLAIKTGQLDLAIKLLEEHKAYGENLPFAYFNVATALSRQDSHGAAIAYYDQAVKAVYKFEPVTEDDLALLDKIRTASGYNYLLAGYNRAAVEEFEQVQLDSLDSDMALLGYGRASVEETNYLAALKPWNELAQRSLVTPAAQEALLSMPVAYEELGATGEALSAYEYAEATYISELERIDELLQYLDENRLEAAASLNEPANWFETRAEAASAPKARQLSELFSLNRFQAKVHEFQDINQLREMIQMWTNRLDLYSGMLDERQLLREQDQNSLAALNVEGQIHDLESKSLELRQKIETIELGNDYLALITGDLASLLGRTEDSQARVTKMREAGEDVSAFEDSVRLYSGLLLWQAAEDFSDDLYEGKQSIRSMEKELAALKGSHTRVTQILSEAPDISPYQQRINELRSRLDDGSAQLDKLIGQSEGELLNEIISELNIQKRRLRVYLSQARLSIARIYDASSQGFNQ